MILPLRVFGRLSPKRMSLGLAIGPISLATQLRSSLGDLLRLVAGRARALEHDEGADRLARGVVGPADDGRLGHQLGVGDQRRLDLHRAHAVADDVEHVVDAAGDREVAGLRVADRAVAGEVVLPLKSSRVVALLEALGVAPDRADHRRPRLLDDQDAALCRSARRCPVSSTIAAVDAGERQRARARHQRRRARQRRDHVAAGLGLPEGVDDRAAAAADVLVVPLPRGRIDRLADRAEDAQARQVVALRVHRRRCLRPP